MNQPKLYNFPGSTVQFEVCNNGNGEFFIQTLPLSIAEQHGPFTSEQSAIDYASGKMSAKDKELLWTKWILNS